MTSHDHVFKGLSDLMGFCGHRPCGSSGAAAKIVCMTLQDHVINGSGDFMEEVSSLHIPTQPKLIAIDIVLIDI